MPTITYSYGSGPIRRADVPTIAAGLTPDDVTPGAGAPTESARLRSLAKTARVASAVKVEGRFPAVKWAWTERLHDTNPAFTQQSFLSVQEQNDPDIKKAFGTSTPHSGLALLHYAGDPPAGAPEQPYPILLIHGATKDATYWTEAGGDMPHGTAEDWRQKGFRVYAITFAHNQDDNFYWAEQTVNAALRVQQLEKGKPVIPIGHSKGGAAVNIAIRPQLRETWMKPYIENLFKRPMLMASPNGGLDYSFRFSAPSLGAAAFSVNAPTPYNRVWYNIMPVDTTDRSFDNAGKNYFPGQDQMLSRLDDEHPLPADMTDPFHNTYYGGKVNGLFPLGIFSANSRGIEYYINQGGNLIERMKTTPIARDLDVVVMAGNKANLPFFINDTSCESDGLLPVSSAMFTPKGTRVLAARVFPVNHTALTSDRNAADFAQKLASKP